jgi:flagellar protein FlaF
MYQFSYAEVLEDDPQESRERERVLLHRAVELLKAARDTGPASREGIEALAFLRRIWTVLLDDLVSPENGLPEKLRASLISIGIWILKEADLIRVEHSRTMDGLIAVNETIRDGLARAVAPSSVAA